MSDYVRERDYPRVGWAIGALRRGPARGAEEHVLRGPRPRGEAAPGRLQEARTPVVPGTSSRLGTYGEVTGSTLADTRCIDPKTDAVKEGDPMAQGGARVTVEEPAELVTCESPLGPAPHLGECAEPAELVACESAPGPASHLGECAEPAELVTCESPLVGAASGRVREASRVRGMRVAPRAGVASGRVRQSAAGPGSRRAGKDTAPNRPRRRSQSPRRPRAAPQHHAVGPRPLQEVAELEP
ncbi:hypothetical protein DFJ69_0301 [Thermomonospora umbrina]|uniref:Uncharacterized protein n=1 Tax=Thermomonospora umbrina TaxID=111806 RepID=A0A3D9SGA2_9ACTN|nr:hypothetical protein DFJ69_0301 [Thermomonospora umbrina]